MNENVLLTMTDIDKTFPGVKALDNAQLKVKRGSVHALMGENGAGKSTLMKCLYGIYFRDSGTIELDGKEINFTNSKEALDHGVAMIHQELQPIPKMTVAENIFLGNYPMKGVFIDHDKMNKETKRYLDIIGLKVEPDTQLGELTISQQQSVEIAKAISHDAKIIIMDEPTSSLTSTEVANLFRVINKLRDDGLGIVYISHKMDEILKISDEITIMRDGQYVGTYDAKHITTQEIIRHMVGRELNKQFPERDFQPQDENILEVKNFTSPRSNSFKNCSFELKKGEILGVAGLVGAQRTELMEAIFGIRAIEPGSQLFLHGKEVKINDSKDAIKNGVALVTEDRRQSGIFGVLSITDNVSVASLRNYTNALGLLQGKKIKEMVDQEIKALNVRTPSRETLIQNLSGGNQQKVILSRWLVTSPEVFILDEPTRGIDVGAKFEIYEIINALAKQGKSIILISSEMSEIIGMSNRIMVMCEGEISGFVNQEDATQEKIMSLATRFMTS